MSHIMIAPPENFQLQSLLVRLPLEIKYMIYDYCFFADGPIVDPVIGCKRPEGGKGPTLGINLLQTCRRIYHEADRRSLFSQNTFRFTTVDRVRSFFRSLGDQCSASVHDIEIDARKFHSDHPGIAREWLDYLAWGGSAWAKILGSLHEDAPNLKCLRLNFQSWPTIPMHRASLWNLLGSMLLHIEGLERVVVTGASKGGGMAKRDPWSPVHFVGGDDVGTDDLVQRMWKTVKTSKTDDDLDKVVRWARRGAKLQLEVVTKAYLVRNIDQDWAGPVTRKKHTDPWPENGTCTWSAYHFRDSDVTEPMATSANPSAAE